MTEKEARRLRALVIIGTFIVIIVLCMFFRRGEASPRSDYYVPWISEKFGKEIYLSDADFKLLCHTVHEEAGNQTIEAQRLVAVTILNRVGSDYFPDNLHDVIYQRWRGKAQFNVIDKPGFPDAYEITDDTELASYLAIATYPMEPENMLFFRSGYYFEEYDPYVNDGDMFFSLK